MPVDTESKTFARECASMELELSDEGTSTECDWTEKEESWARLKVDFCFLPLIIAGHFVFQVDKANIGSALTSTITEDLGIDTNQINVGNQLLSLGVVLFEIPFNMLLMKIGPRIWLSAQIVAWGLVATFQAWINSYGSYLATRLLLGCMEAGFIPGCLYYLGTWYKRDEIRLRTTFFYLGQNFATATTTLLAAGIFRLDGAMGWAGWRWLFLIDGIITLAIGVLFVLFIPPSVGDGRPLISFGRWSYFTEKESRLLKTRVVIDDPSKLGGEHVRVRVKDILQVFSSPKKWMHCLIQASAVCAVHSLITYSPRILSLGGFSMIRANALYSVAAYAAMFFNPLLAYGADRCGHSAPFVLIAVTWNVIAYGCLTMLTEMTPWQRYAGLVIAGMAYSSMPALNIGWISNTYTSPQDRSMSSAMIIMSANIGGIPAGQIFRKDDAPFYYRGTSILAALGGFCWLMVASLGLWYRHEQKRGKPARSAIA